MPAKTAKTREDEITERMRELEEKYTEDGVVRLGNAMPDELRELGKLNRELTELRKPQPAEVTA